MKSSHRDQALTPLQWILSPRINTSFCLDVTLEYVHWRVVEIGSNFKVVPLRSLMAWRTLSLCAHSSGSAEVISASSLRDSPQQGSYSYAAMLGQHVSFLPTAIVSLAVIVIRSKGKQDHRLWATFDPADLVGSAHCQMKSADFSLPALSSVASPPTQPSGAWSIWCVARVVAANPSHSWRVSRRVRASPLKLLVAFVDQAKRSNQLVLAPEARICQSLSRESKQTLDDFHGGTAPEAESCRFFTICMVHARVGGPVPFPTLSVPWWILKIAWVSVSVLLRDTTVTLELGTSGLKLMWWRHQRTGC